MNASKKMILIPILIVIFTFVFTALNTGLDLKRFNQIIQPLIFALSITICILYSNFRKYLINASVVLLLSMVLTYMFNMLEIANWLGSLGFGMLFITIMSYLPQLIKKGNLEKF